ncbi:flagellar protein FlaG [Breoghania sp.]|uniref:flagellar protein FlaG n=1 Tax=Breoghania sp. TaxID=2065378 RepID=UPI002AA80D97|nr:flagellar protein FlaG [Breoghania sp.]
MDAGVLKPVSAFSQNATAQAQYALRSPTANETELPPEQVVTPVTESEAGGRSRTDNERTNDQPIKRENFFDQETDTLIYRALDPESGDVIRQIPEEAMLRLRQALAEQAAPHVAAAGVNIGAGDLEPSISRTL